MSKMENNMTKKATYLTNSPTLTLPPPSESETKQTGYRTTREQIIDLMRSGNALDQARDARPTSLGVLTYGGPQDKLEHLDQIRSTMGDLTKAKAEQDKRKKARAQQTEKERNRLADLGHQIERERRANATPKQVTT